MRQLGSRIATTTIETLVAFFNAASNLAASLAGIPFGTSLTGLNIPAYGTGSSVQRIIFNADVTFKDGTTKTFYRIVDDCQGALTVSELYDCAEGIATTYILGYRYELDKIDDIQFESVTTL